MFVTPIKFLVLSVVSGNSGRSWNVLLMDTGVLLYYDCFICEKERAYRSPSFVPSALFNNAVSSHKLLTTEHIIA
jgi:hypothetical protein